MHVQRCVCIPHSQTTEPEYLQVPCPAVHALSLSGATEGHAAAPFAPPSLEPMSVLAVPLQFASSPTASTLTKVSATNREYILDGKLIFLALPINGK